MSENKNIQILIETMTRCAGNCSGCALSSSERMETDFDMNNFLMKTKLVSDQLVKLQSDSVESVTLFLGQGDHFLMKHSEIEPFVKACSEMVPLSLKQKTVVFITASAIGKHEQIKEKMDSFYKYSLKYNIPFFIQVVFDPKKMKINQKFKDIYINNILYFKEKCGMTEVTVNMGEDLLNHITPQEFHNWIKEYQFKHIEMNWVTNQFTYSMWKSIYNDMFSWLKNWLDIYKNDPIYEINFLPFLSRHLKYKNVNIMKMTPHIEESLENNLYIDYNGNFFSSQMGLISNLTPFGERLSHNVSFFNNKTSSLSKDKITNKSRKIIRELIRKENCSDCEYKSVCSISAITQNFNYKEDNHENNECPWNVKSFLSYLENEILNHKKYNNRDITNTIFNKNPVQHIEMKKENNETYTYFENLIKL